MFREMRRIKQQLTPEESVAVLERGTSGVLAVSGDEGWPYAVPLNYVYADGRIYFHGALSGHKLDAICREERVSFCVIDSDKLAPADYTNHFRSVIVFGRARVVSDQAQRRAALARIAARCFPDDPAGREREIDKALPRTAIIELTIEHLSGKEALELRSNS